jgi:hypothetical protein
MSLKYFYIEDDTGTLFAANGTALTALLVGITNIVPLIKFPIPTLPMWLYFLGLIFAFFSKAMVQIMNEDTLQREKLQNARDFLVNTNEKNNLTLEMKNQLDDSWKYLDQQHKSLLKLSQIPLINKLRATFFFLSALCFLMATAQLIYLASVLRVS